MAIDRRVYEMFRDIGRDMYVHNLISSHGGNISIRVGDRMIIKRRGAMLGRLKPEDLVETGLTTKDSGIAIASTESIVHRAIYKATPALAVVHSHARYAVAYSLSRDEIMPVDNEGSYFLKKVPVVEEEFASGSPQMAETVANALKSYKVIVLRGHGTFAIGQTLDEAFQWTDAVEEACQIMLFVRIINEPFIEYRKRSDEYKAW
ncbi:MAG: aldolase [Anaerolineae bacterium]|nr:aldolase [Anaerolineae bacterium]